MSAQSNENSIEKLDTDESESDDNSYIKTRRGIIQINKTKQEKKPDRLNGEYSYQNIIKQRLIGQPCIDCKMECDLRIAERFRQDNYLNFWGKIKTWDERRIHVRRLVYVLYTPHPQNKIRKKFLRKYYLEMDGGFTPVCKTMFFNTLAISAKFVETTIQKFPDNVLDESKIQLVHNHRSQRKNIESSNESVSTYHTNGNKKTESRTSPLNDLPNDDDEIFDIKNKVGIKPSCSCSEECGKKIPQDTRIKIYEHFWLKLGSSDERKLFIINTIKKDRYTSIQAYVLPMKDGHITVCQEMYLNTLALNENTLQIIMPIKTQHTAIPQEMNNLNESKTLPNTANLQLKETQEYILPFKRTKLQIKPLKPPCSCRLKCNLKLTEYIRKQIHTEFWNLPAQVDQKHFILSTVQTQTYRNKITKEKRQEIKNFMLPLHYDNIIVCKKMYLQTLSINEHFVTDTINNINIDGSIAEDDLQNFNTQTTNNTCQEPIKLLPRKSQTKENNESDDLDFINCGDLLESQIKEDVLHSEKTEVKKNRKERLIRKMGPPCPSSCRHQCSERINKEQRKELHDGFWLNMNWQERKQFIMDTVEEFPIKNRSISGKRAKRNFSRKYTLPHNEKKIVVCQKMYFNTLSICSRFVSTIHIWASQVKW